MNTYFNSTLLKSMVAFCTIVTFISCSENKEKQEKMTENILLEEWTGPYEGVPAFDKMNINDVQSAIEKGMEIKLKEIDEIIKNAEAPTFENTIVPMEKSGKELDRVLTYYRIWGANVSSPEFRKIQGEMAPVLSEFSSKISQNEELFKRIKKVYDNSLVTPLEDDQQRVIQLIYEGFAMNGAELDEEKKARYATINKELSSIYTNFANNVLADEENYVVYLTKDQLSGLSESMTKSMAQTAEKKVEKVSLQFQIHALICLRF